MRGKLLSAAVATTALAFGACGGEDEQAGGGGGGAKKLTNIKVASAPNAFLSALYVAKDDGLFEKEGLNVEVVEVSSGNDSISALASGQAQYADVGFEDLMELREEGDDSVILVHDILDRVTLTLVMRKQVADRLRVTPDSPLEERLKALKGLKIGITSPGAPSDTYTRFYLRTVGLNPERDVDIIPLDSAPALLAALEEGQIDAYQLSPPTPYVAAEEGFGVVLVDGPKGEVPEFEKFSYTAWGTTRSWAEDNPEAAKAFSRAIAKATEKVKSSPDEVSEQVLDDIGGQDPAVIKRTVKAIVPALNPNGCFDPAIVKTTLDTMVKNELGEGDADPAEDALWSNKYNAC
jgi:NitT/TauT family transport system substrate-binding protein